MRLIVYICGMENKQDVSRYYLSRIKTYLKQVQLIYRLGVCIPAILSPLSLFPFFSEIHLLMWGGSLWFLLLLYHYTIYTKMVCRGLLILCVANFLISFCIILKWDTAQLILCVPTCLFAIYQSIDVCTSCKEKTKREDSKNK